MSDNGNAPQLPGPPEGWPGMRSAAAVQLAHDVLAAVVLGEVVLPGWPANDPATRGALDVLCWVLQHEHSLAFKSVLYRLHKAMAEAGVRIVYSPPTHPPAADSGS